MAHPLDGFRLKLNRANSHFETLDAEIESWLAQKPYGIVGNYEPGPPEKYIFSYRLFDPPPMHWALLIGEFAHQARSALDHLVWQLVLLNNRRPTIRNQFPILVFEDDWKGRNGRGRLAGVGRTHIDQIEALQPYKRVGPNEPPILRLIGRDPLLLLAGMNNEDKHRVLIPTTGNLNSIGFDVIAIQDIAPLDDIGTADIWANLEDRAPLIEVPVTATGPKPKVEMEIHERLDITIRQRVEVKDGSYTETSVYLRQGMRDILDRLRYIFEVFVGEFG